MSENQLSNKELLLEIEKLRAERDALLTTNTDISQIIQAVFAATNDMVFYKDTRGIYRACNLSFAKYIALNINEIIGYSDFDLCPRERAEFFISQDKQVIKEQEPLIFEDWGISGDGEQRLMETCKSPILNKENEVIGIIGVSRDITQHKDIEAKLRASETKFRTLVEFSPDAYYLCDLKGIIQDGNKAAEKLSGYRKQDLIGKNFLHAGLLSANHITKAASLLAKNAMGKSTGPDVFKIKRKNGSEVVLEISTCPINIEGRKSVFGIVRDVTEKKNAEKALQESEERYHLLSDATFEAIIVSEKGICINQNKAAEKMFGFSLGEVIGRTLIDGIAPEDQEKVINNMSSGYELPYEVNAIHKDGHSFPIEIKGRNLKYKGKSIRITAIQDISEKKKNEAALRNSEEYHRNLIEHSTDVISILEFNGNIKYESPSLERVLGYPGGQLLEQNAFHLIHPDDTEGIREKFAKLLNFPGETEEVNFRFKHHDGSWRYLEGSATNLLSVESIKGIVVNYRDITDRRQLEEQLQQDQKMKAVGQLAGGIAHDFNNLLTVINGYGALLSAMDLQPGTENAIGEIQKAGERAAGLTNQLLTFSRKQFVQPKVVNLNKLITDHNKMLLRLLGEHIYVRTEWKAEHALVNIDPGQMEQVMMNIVINARDAMPNGGNVDINTQNVVVPEHQNPEFPGLLPGAYIQITVSDSGSGMDEATMKRVFEPFFTTKGQNKGTGLGLSTVYGIIRQSGGFIYVRSELGTGSEFIIFLPLVCADGKPESLPESNNGSFRGNETILLVEDDPGVREVTKVTLADYGYKVFTAADGQEGISVYKENKAEIDMVLTDVVMPNMSGREMADQLRCNNANLKIMYFSGYTDDTIVHHGVLDDGMFFIQKPYSGPDLAKKIRQVLESE